MTTSRRRGRSQRLNALPRKRLWIDTLISEDTANGTQDDADLMATPSQFDKHGLTLVRTIVMLTIRPTTLAAAAGLAAHDIGIALVDQDALAAGALPDLNFGDDSPIKGWIFRKRVIIEDSSTAGIISPTSQRIELDLKSKRLIGDSELILIMNQNVAQGTGFTTHTEGLIRCLFLLP